MVLQKAFKHRRGGYVYCELRVWFRMSAIMAHHIVTGSVFENGFDPTQCVGPPGMIMVCEAVEIPTEKRE